MCTNSVEFVMSRRAPLAITSFPIPHASPPSLPPQVWVVYHSKMKTKQVYLHDSTYATPFSLMLWGARVRHERPLGHKKKEAVEVVIGETIQA